MECFFTIVFQLYFKIYHQQNQENENGLEPKRAHQLFVQADDVNLLGKEINTTKKENEAVLDRYS
jgi:hypothetical protein